MRSKEKLGLEFGRIRVRRLINWGKLELELGRKGLMNKRGMGILVFIAKV